MTWYQLLADRSFLRPTLAGALAQAGMSAYISASPFAFIEVYGVPASAYGWLFGRNAVGLIAASQWNRRLLSKGAMEPLPKRAHAANALYGVLLAAFAASGIGGLPLLMVPLFGYIASLGLTFPNSAAAPMASFPRQAATASSQFGTIQFALAAITGTLAGRLHDGTALPMAGIIAASGASAVAMRRLFARPRGSVSVKGGQALVGGVHGFVGGGHARESGERTEALQPEPSLSRAWPAPTRSAVRSHGGWRIHGPCRSGPWPRKQSMP